MQGLPMRQAEYRDWQLADIEVCIAGINNFNNEVLSNFLESKTGLRCHCLSHSNLLELNQYLERKPTLLYLDCKAVCPSPAPDNATFIKGLQIRRAIVVCFNVNPDDKLERIALQQGVKGVIYTHNPIDFYAKSAQAILNGQLWYPRSVLEKYIMANETQQAWWVEKGIKLTRREKQILYMLSSGMQNQDMAEDLCISPHTVKTHVYNLFKKIKVSNRLEAVQWLSDNRYDTTNTTQVSP